MVLSRKIKRATNAQVGWTRMMCIFLWIGWVLLLYNAWQFFGLLVCTLLILVTIIHTFMVNAYHIRSWLPGLEQGFSWSKIVSAISYVLLVFWLVSEMSKGN